VVRRAAGSLCRRPDRIWRSFWPGSVVQQQRPSRLDRLRQRPHPMGILAQVDRQSPSPLAPTATQPDQHVRQRLPGTLGLLDQHQPHRMRRRVTASAPYAAILRPVSVCITGAWCKRATPLWNFLVCLVVGLNTDQSDNRDRVATRQIAARHFASSDRILRRAATGRLHEGESAPVERRGSNPIVQEK
jgi:hypothetical protein